VIADAASSAARALAAVAGRIADAIGAVPAA
jgi:hypothetical protein